MKAFLLIIATTILTAGSAYAEQDLLLGANMTSPGDDSGRDDPG